MDAYHVAEEVEMMNDIINEVDVEDDEGSNVIMLDGSAEQQQQQQQQGQSMTSLLYNAVHNPNQVMAMLSNYSTSYNVVNVGIALPVLNYYMRSLSSSSSSPDEQQQQSSEYYYHYDSSPSERSLVDNISSNESQNSSLVASSLMAGMIIGQLLGGILGDILGRKTAMILVMIIQIGASLGSAIFVSTTTNTINDDGLLLLTLTTTALEQLAIWRFILGVGAGGVYPLAAVMSAETTTTTNEKQERNEISAAAAAAAVNTADYQEVVEEREDTEENDNDNNDTVSSFQRIALTFSTQGLGFITVPLLAYPMLELGVDTNIIWRVLLGMGALPGIVMLYLRLKDNYCGQRRRTIIETEEIIAVSAINTPTESDVDMTATVESTIAGGSDDSNESALIDNSYLEDNRHCRRTMRGGSQSSRGLWESIKAETGLAKKLVGTAGTWFLFDIVFYGNALFEPVVLEAAFGSSSAAAGTTNNNTDDFGVLRSVVRDSLVISCLSLPGYFITVALIGRRTCVNMCRTGSSTRFGSAMMCCPPYDQTPIFIQIQGFLIMFILYIIIGVFWTSLINNEGLLLLLYSGTFLFANYGPNATTFLLPSVTYSEECRSTLNGLCAAAGKVGAVVGASIFAPAIDIWGVNVVMICCGFVSLIALALTQICLG